jgi:hypothetical protein
VRNPHAGTEPGRRRLIIGANEGNRALMRVIERTIGNQLVLSPTLREKW